MKIFERYIIFFNDREKIKYADDNTAMITGITWKRLVIANNNELGIIDFLFTIPSYKYPVNITKNARDIEKENCPANVDGIFPPYIELFSKKRKESMNIADIIGIGYLNPIFRVAMNADTGNRNEPNIVTSLNAISNGII